MVSSTNARKPSTPTWSRTYRNIIINPGSVQVTSDGGFVVAGKSAYAWVMKTDSSGEPEWEREYLPTGYGDAEASSVQQTRDHGYIVAGELTSSGYAPSSGWLLKLDHSGNVEWSNAYGGPSG